MLIILFTKIAALFADINQENVVMTAQADRVFVLVPLAAFDYTSGISAGAES